MPWFFVISQLPILGMVNTTRHSRPLKELLSLILVIARLGISLAFYMLNLVIIIVQGRYLRGLQSLSLAVLEPGITLALSILNPKTTRKQSMLT